LYVGAIADLETTISDGIISEEAIITQAEIILPKYQHELKMAVNLPRWGEKGGKKVSPQISQS